jgi:hypothetical protein
VDDLVLPYKSTGIEMTLVNPVLHRLNVTQIIEISILFLVEQINPTVKNPTMTLFSKSLENVDVLPYIRCWPQHRPRTFDQRPNQMVDRNGLNTVTSRNGLTCPYLFE